MSRGLRNNNPGNIRRSAVRYRGEVASPDPAFKRFASAAWGYRAVFVLLHTYRVRYGLRTIDGWIARWAPPVENDTAAYTAFVAQRSGIAPDAEVDTLDGASMRRIVAAMSRMENGRPAVGADVEAGWRLFSDDFAER